MSTLGLLWLSRDGTLVRQHVVSFLDPTHKQTSMNQNVSLRVDLYTTALKILRRLSTSRNMRTQA